MIVHYIFIFTLECYTICPKYPAMSKFHKCLLDPGSMPHLISLTINDNGGWSDLVADSVIDSISSGSAVSVDITISVESDTIKQ